MVILLCKKCCKSKRERKAIASAMPTGSELVPVRCQKICKGPVIGFPLDGCLEWFRRVSSEGALAGLKAAIDAGQLNKSLRLRRVTKRAGKRR